MDYVVSRARVRGPESARFWRGELLLAYGARGHPWVRESGIFAAIGWPGERWFFVSHPGKGQSATIFLTSHR